MVTVSIACDHNRTSPGRVTDLAGIIFRSAPVSYSGKDRSIHRLRGWAQICAVPAPVVNSPALRNIDRLLAVIVIIRFSSDVISDPCVAVISRLNRYTREAEYFKKRLYPVIRDKIDFICSGENAALQIRNTAGASLQAGSIQILFPEIRNRRASDPRLRKCRGTDTSERPYR